MSRLAAAVLACVLALMAPAAWGQGHAPDRSGEQPVASAPYLPFEDAWPARYGDGSGATGHGVAIPLDAAPTALAMRRGFLPGARPAREEDLADIRALLGKRADEAGITVVLEGPNSIVFERSDRPGSGIGVGPGPEAGPFKGFTFKIVSGVERAVSGRAEIALQRTWFAWYDAIDESGEPGTGAMRRAALVMPGLFGNPDPVVDRLVGHLRRNGYGVLRMFAQPSRFTERIEFVIDPDDPGSAAERIAGVLGDRAAECAYAVESAWGYAESKRPDLAALPKVVIGMSGGAMSLPTVLARDQDHYGAAVLIAGSADFWLTNERSNYRAMVDAVRARWTTPPTEEERATLDRAYLASAPLDSFHTAAALKGRPVLMLHGTIDLAAPAALGDLLWERLGRPERWTYPVGHELLFAGLPGEFGRITAWLDRAIGPGGASE